MRRPFTLVAIGLNGPRYSMGAPGFGSKVSRWAGPPQSQSNNTEWALPATPSAAAARSRTATAYFNVAGHAPGQVAEHLAACRVNVWDGDNYAWELTGALGIRDTGSAVRAGVVHYNDRSDVDRLLAGVAELAA